MNLFQFLSSQSLPKSHPRAFQESNISTKKTADVHDPESIPQQNGCGHAPSCAKAPKRQASLLAIPIRGFIPVEHIALSHEPAFLLLRPEPLHGSSRRSEDLLEGQHLLCCWSGIRAPAPRTLSQRYSFQGAATPCAAFSGQVIRLSRKVLLALRHLSCVLAQR